MVLVKRVGTVFLGAAAAQAIAFVSMIVLARICGPEEIGSFSAWLSFVTVASVFFTGRYELAFFSGRGANDSAAIGKLVVCVALTLAVISIGILFLIDTAVVVLPVYVSEYLLPLVMTALGIAVNRTIMGVLVLQQNFAGLSYSRVILSIGVASAQLAAGWLALGVPGLVYGQLVGVISATCASMFVVDRQWLWLAVNTPLSVVKQTLIVHVRFAQFSLPADLISSISSQLPVLMIAASFGPGPAGMYAITYRILGGPVSMLANSVLEVFKEQAARDVRQFGQCVSTYLSTLLLLASLALLPFLMLWFGGEWLFGVLFGAGWEASGRFAEILSPLFYLSFVASPLSYTIYIAQKQSYDLAWQAILFIVTFLAFFLTDNIYESVKLYAYCYSAMYCIYLYISYRCALGSVVLGWKRAKN